MVNPVLPTKHLSFNAIADAITTAVIDTEPIVTVHPIPMDTVTEATTPRFIEVQAMVIRIIDMVDGPTIMGIGMDMGIAMGMACDQAAFSLDPTLASIGRGLQPYV